MEYEKLKNRKLDAIRKFVSKVKKENDFIGVQDESIAAWKSSHMKGWGRSVQYSIMGGIIREIKKLSQTQIVDKWVPTSQECRICGKKTRHSLDQRTFVCSHCGHTEDRDVHSAKVVLKKAKFVLLNLTIRMGHTNTMPVESATSTHESIMIDEQAASLSQEAPSVNSG